MAPLKFFLNIIRWAQALETIGPEASGDALGHPGLQRLNLQQLADLPLPYAGFGQPAADNSTTVSFARCA